MRVKLLVSALLAVLLSIPLMAQNRGSAEASVDGKQVRINYGRPTLSGRDLLSQARPGMVWRLGMNEATEIESSGSLVVAGKELMPGKYSLWAKMTGENAWVLAFHPRTGIWGQPELTSGYVAEMPLAVERLPSPVERLTISLAEKSGDAAVTIQWGSMQLTGTLGVQ